MRLTKKKREQYKRQCLIRYYGLLSAFFCDFCVKAYFCTQTGSKLLVVVGVIVDFSAKWYMLKSMKMRKKGYYNES